MTTTIEDLKPKEIPLSRGKVALVDADDYEWLSQFRWCLSVRGYACRGRRIDKTRVETIYMHREILKLAPGKVADHINENKLDNRKANLRSCCLSENTKFWKHNHPNRPYEPNLEKKKYSKIKGVSFHKAKGRWIAALRRNGKMIFYGYFNSEDAAATAYSEALRLYIKENSQRVCIM